MKFPQNTFFVSLILFFLGLLTYSNMLFSDFIGDDIARIVLSETSYKSGPFVLMEKVLSDRPILMLSLWLNYYFGGLNPFGYKLVNVLIHCFCGISLFFLLKQILYRLQNADVFAFCGACLFLVHPIQNQAINSIIQRGVGLSTLFAFLSFICFYRFINSDLKKRSMHLLSLLFFILAVASKPNTATLPLFFLAYLLFDKKQSPLNSIRTLTPFLFVLCIPLFFYSVSGQNVQTRALSSLDYFLIQTKVVLFYFQKYLIPTDLMFFYKLNNDFPRPPDSITWLAVGFHFISILTAVFYCFFKKSHAALFILFGYLSLIPESSFFSINHPIFDHRNYFAFPFFASFAVLFVAGTVKLLKLNYFFKTLFVILPIMVFAYLNFSYTGKINTYEKWALYNLSKNPHYINFYTLTITTDARRGKQDFAVSFTDEAIKLNPNDLELRQLKRLLLLDQLSHKEQLSVLNEVIEFAKRPEGFSRFVFNFYEHIFNVRFQSLLSFEEYIYKMNDFYLYFWRPLLSPSSEPQAIIRMRNNMVEMLRLNKKENPTPATFFDNIETEKALHLLKSLLVLKVFFDYPKDDINDYLQILIKKYPHNATAKGIVNWLLNLQKNLQSSG